MAGSWLTRYTRRRSGSSSSVSAVSWRILTWVPTLWSTAIIRLTQSERS